MAFAPVYPHPSNLFSSFASSAAEPINKQLSPPPPPSHYNDHSSQRPSYSLPAPAQHPPSSMSPSFTSYPLPSSTRYLPAVPPPSQAPHHHQNVKIDPTFNFFTDGSDTYHLTIAQWNFISAPANVDPRIHFVKMEYAQRALRGNPTSLGIDAVVAIIPRLQPTSDPSTRLLSVYRPSHLGQQPVQQQLQLHNGGGSGGGVERSKVSSLLSFEVERASSSLARVQKHQPFKPSPLAQQQAPPPSPAIVAAKSSSSTVFGPSGTFNETIQLPEASKRSWDLVDAVAERKRKSADSAPSSPTFLVASSRRTLGQPFAPLPRRAQHQEPTRSVNESHLPSPPESSASSSPPVDQESELEEQWSSSPEPKRQKLEIASPVKSSIVVVQTEAAQVEIKIDSPLALPYHPSPYPHPFNTPSVHFNAFVPSSPHPHPPPSLSTCVYPSARPWVWSPSDAFPIFKKVYNGAEKAKTINPSAIFNRALIGHDGVQGGPPSAQTIWS